VELEGLGGTQLGQTKQSVREEGRKPLKYILNIYPEYISDLFSSLRL